MSEPRWLTREIVLVIHASQLAEHGGAQGLRDEGALESALARPRQKEHYDAGDIAAYAAAYAFGLCSNHPFLDGNKRVALAALDVFLRLNGRMLNATEVNAATMILDLAAGRVDEPTLATWIRASAAQM